MPTTRAQRKVIIKEDAKYALEELWSYDPEDAFYKIFKREAKHGRVDVIISLSKEDICQLSYRDDSNNVVHVSRTEAGKIKILQFYFKNLHDHGSYPDDILFCFTSISFEECKIFRKHHNNTLTSQGDNVSAPIPNNLLHSSQINKTSKSSLTKNQFIAPKLSSSIKPSASTSSSLIKDTSPLNPDGSQHLEFDSLDYAEPNPSISSLFDQMIGSSAISNGEETLSEDIECSSNSPASIFNDRMTSKVERNTGCKGALQISCIHSPYYSWGAFAPR